MSKHQNSNEKSKNDINKPFSDALNYCLQRLKIDNYYDSDNQSETLSWQSVQLGQEIYQLLLGIIKRISTSAVSDDIVSDSEDNIYINIEKLEEEDDPPDDTELNNNNTTTKFIDTKFASEKVYGKTLDEISDCAFMILVKDSSVELSDSKLTNDSSDTLVSKKVHIEVEEFDPESNADEKMSLVVDNNDVPLDPPERNNVCHSLDSVCQEKALDEAKADCKAPSNANSICILEQEDEDTELNEKDDQDENTETNFMSNSRQLAGEKIKNSLIFKDIQAQKKAINDLIFSQCVEHKRNNKILGNKLIQKWGYEAEKTLVAGNFQFSPSFSWINKFKKQYNITGENFDLKIDCEPKIESSSVVFIDNSESKNKSSSPDIKFKCLDDDKNDSDFEEGDVGDKGYAGRDDCKSVVEQNKQRKSLQKSTFKFKCLDNDDAADKNDSDFHEDFYPVVKLNKLIILPRKSAEFESLDNGDDDKNDFDFDFDEGNVDIKEEEDNDKPVVEPNERKKSLRKSTSTFKRLDSEDDGDDKKDIDFYGGDDDYKPLAKRGKRRVSVRNCLSKKFNRSSDDEMHDEKRKEKVGHYNLRDMINDNIKRRKIKFFDSSTDSGGDNDEKTLKTRALRRRGRPRKYSEEY